MTCAERQKIKIGHGAGPFCGRVVVLDYFRIPFARIESRQPFV